jgi:hypothetical protein
MSHKNSMSQVLCESSKDFSMAYALSTIADFVYLPFIRPCFNLAFSWFFLKKITNLENVLCLSQSRSLINIALTYCSFTLMRNNVRRGRIVREMCGSN